MKKLVITLVLFCVIHVSKTNAQSGVSISDQGNPPDSSAMLDVSSQTQGVLIPRLTTVQRNSIQNPAPSLLVFNTDSSCFEFFIDGGWNNLCSHSVGEVTQANSSSVEKIQSISYEAPYGSTNYRKIIASMYSDRFALLLTTFTPHKIFLQLENANYQECAIASTEFPICAALLGNNLYVLTMKNANPNIYSLYRFDADNIAAGGVTMTFSGLSLTNTESNMRMTSDGIDLYFSYNAGNSTESYNIAKYSVSGNTLTYQQTIICGTSSNSFNYFFVQSTGDIFGIANSVNNIYRFDQSGNLINTVGNLSHLSYVWNWEDAFYISEPNDGNVYTRYYYEE